MSTADSNHTTAVRACHAGAPAGEQLLRLYAYKARRYAAYKWCYITSRPQVTSSFKILRVMCVSSVYVGSWGLAVTLCCLVDEYQPCKGTCYLHVQDTRWRQQVPQKSLYLPTYQLTWRHILGDCNLKPHTRYSMIHRLTNWHLWKVLCVRN